MNFGILDLEMTCDGRKEGKKFIDDGRLRHAEREIISVGFIVVDEKYALKNSYASFVKPARNSILSEYCKNLTGITQAEVDGGKICNDAFFDIAEMCRNFSVEIILTFDRFDKAGVINSAKFCKDADEPYENLNVIAQKILDVKPIAVSNDNQERLSLSKIAKMLHIETDAAKHNALNDALLLRKICKRVNFKIRSV